MYIDSEQTKRNQARILSDIEHSKKAGTWLSHEELKLQWAEQDKK